MHPNIDRRRHGGSVSGRYPEPPLLIRRALDEDTLPVRDAQGLLVRMFTRFTCSMHFYAVPCKLAEFYCTMPHHATALSRLVLAKAGATGAETQVLRGMDFFV